MSDSMVERALDAFLRECGWSEDALRDMKNGQYSSYQRQREAMRAAIAAIREPTEAMARQGDGASCFWHSCEICNSGGECAERHRDKAATESDVSAYHVWRAMIDEALKD